MKIATNRLTGNALIWAVILAGRHQPVQTTSGIAFKSDHGSWDFPRCDRAEAAEILVREWISVERPFKGQTPPTWKAIVDNKQRGPRQELHPVLSATGATFELAVHRAFVASYFGEVIDMPDELISIVDQPVSANEVSATFPAPQAHGASHVAA